MTIVRAAIVIKAVATKPELVPLGGGDASQLLQVQVLYPLIVEILRLLQALGHTWVVSQQPASPHDESGFMSASVTQEEDVVEEFD